MIDPFQMKCPKNIWGGYHHFIPRGMAGAQVNECRDCGKTEKQLREEAADA